MAMWVGWLVTDRMRRSETSSSVRVTGQVISNMDERVALSAGGYEWQK
jgi:hypothetical protein